MAQQVVPKIGPGDRKNGSRGVDISGVDLRKVARELTAAVAGEVRFGLHDRLLYATDASIYQVEPLGVVVPASVEDAKDAVGFCGSRGLPMLPRGGGTSLAGQCVNRAIVIDTSANCCEILECDLGGRTCRVEAGITIGDLNEHLAGTGLFFPVDPSTYRQANIGGCIGNNAAGSHSIVYGRTSESLLGVDVCLADGAEVRLDRGAALRDGRIAQITQSVVEIVRRHERLIRERFPKTIRRNAGYGLDMILAQLDEGKGDLSDINLAKLIAGSEGTLGLTLRAELALAPIPKSKGLAVLGFASVQEAIDAVVPILETKPAAVELLDDMVIEMANLNSQTRCYVKLLPKPAGSPIKAVLYVEYFAEDGSGVAEGLGRLRERFPGIAMEVHTSIDAMDNAWKLRMAGEPLLHAMPGARKPLGFVEDNAVPPEKLSEFVRRFRRIVSDEGTKAAFWAHASVGVLHVRPLLDIRDPQDEVRMHRIAERVAYLAKDLGGVMSGEHGDGRSRGPLLERFYGPELMGAFREIKAVFDPRNLMNPGNIVDPGGLRSISQHLRVRPAEKVVEIKPSIETFYSYEDQTDFAHAVDMCNGAGVCRKKTGGVMCPSYMGTLDERHSTRGRGNALRLAISGQLSLDPSNMQPDWNDQGTIETLDLCLSCKACKAECPSNVDVARLKAEYTAQRYAAAGHVPTRARVMGSVRTLNRIASFAPRMTNFVNQARPFRFILNRALGLAPQRSLPRAAKSLARQWGDSPQRTGAPRVALFGDCFTMYNEPGIGMAAKCVLEAFGYQVELPMQGRHGCCGRPKISSGLLPQAIREIDGTLSQLRPWIEDESVVAVLFAEPSCLSAAIDDWLALKLTTPMSLRKQLASKAMLVEDFIEQSWDAHPIRPAASAHPKHVLLHGHCHQKALLGPQSSLSALQRFVGDRVEALDAGCCGMAGAFGFQRSKFELSQRIGERALLPAVREAGINGKVVVAPGTSCRHQVMDATGTRAIHPIEFIAECLDD